MRTSGLTVASRDEVFFISVEGVSNAFYVLCVFNLCLTTDLHACYLSDGRNVLLLPRHCTVSLPSLGVLKLASDLVCAVGVRQHQIFNGSSPSRTLKPLHTRLGNPLCVFWCCCGRIMDRCLDGKGHERSHGVREQPGHADRGLDCRRCADNDDVPHGKAKGAGRMSCF